MSTPSNNDNNDKNQENQENQNNQNSPGINFSPDSKKKILARLLKSEKMNLGFGNDPKNINLKKFKWISNDVNMTSNEALWLASKGIPTVEITSIIKAGNFERIYAVFKESESGQLDCPIKGISLQQYGSIKRLFAYDDNHISNVIKMMNIRPVRLDEFINKFIDCDKLLSEESVPQKGLTKKRKLLDSLNNNNSNSNNNNNNNNEKNENNNNNRNNVSQSDINNNSKNSQFKNGNNREFNQSNNNFHTNVPKENNKNDENEKNINKKNELNLEQLNTFNLLNKPESARFYNYSVLSQLSNESQEYQKQFSQAIIEWTKHGILVDVELLNQLNGKCYDDKKKQEKKNNSQETAVFGVGIFSSEKSVTSHKDSIVEALKSNSLAWVGYNTEMDNLYVKYDVKIPRYRFDSSYHSLLSKYNNNFRVVAYNEHKWNASVVPLIKKWIESNKWCVEQQ